MESATQTLHRLTSVERFDEARALEPPVDDPAVVQGFTPTDLHRLPWFYKRYHDGPPRIDLPRRLTATTAGAVDVLAGTADVPRAQLDLSELGRLLFLMSGVTRTAQRPFGRWLFRAAGSAGGRFPLEVYVAVPEGSPLPSGVHWYQPEQHALLTVVEVDRSDRQDRRRRGKSDPLDAVSAARAAQSGRASGAPKGRDGQVEAIRALMVAKRTARSERIQTINQARALIVTGPDDLRARFARHSADDLAAELASLRPRPGSMIRYHTLLSLRELGRRAEFLDGQLQRLDELIVPLVTARAPGLLALYGVGHDTAAKLLIAAGDQ